MEALSGQLSSFVMVMLTGAAWGVFYDLYHSRRPTKADRRRNDPKDLIFWFFSLCLIGFGLILSNWLELRLFVAIGLIVGYVIYAILGRPVIGPLLRGFNRLIDWIVFPFANLKNRLFIRGRFRRAMRLGGQQEVKKRSASKSGAKGARG